MASPAKTTEIRSPMCQPRIRRPITNTRVIRRLNYAAADVKQPPAQAAGRPPAQLVGQPEVLSELSHLRGKVCEAARRRSLISDAMSRARAEAYERTILMMIKAINEFADSNLLQLKNQPL